jgi:hypothetical protein
MTNLSVQPLSSQGLSSTEWARGIGAPFCEPLSPLPQNQDINPPSAMVAGDFREGLSQQLSEETLQLVRFFLGEQSGA